MAAQLSFVGSAVKSAMDTSQHLQNLQANYQRMADIQAQQERDAQDREKAAGLAEYKTYSDLLSDPEKCLVMTDDEYAQAEGGLDAAATRLQGVNLHLPHRAEDTRPAYLSQKVFELQSNPAYANLTWQQKGAYLRSIGGRHLGRVLTTMTNTQKLQDLTAPTSVVTNQADINAKNKQNADITASATQPNTEVPGMSVGLAPPPQEQAPVPEAQTVTTPGMSQDDAYAYQLFGNEGVLETPKTILAALPTRMANYNIAMVNYNHLNSKDQESALPILQAEKAEIVRQGKVAGMGDLTNQLNIAGYVDKSDPFNDEYKRQQMADRKRDDLLRQKAGLLTQIKTLAAGSKDLSASEGNTQPLRKELWAIEQQLGNAPSDAPMPQHYYVISPTTAQQDRQYELQQEGMGIRQEQNARADAKATASAAKPAAGSGGSKPGGGTTSGGGTTEKAPQMNSNARTKALSYGYGPDAIRLMPAEVMSSMGEIERNHYPLTGGRTAKLTAEEVAAIKTIHDRAKAKGGGDGNVAPARDQKINTKTVLQETITWAEKNDPELARRIKNARASGVPVDAILGDKTNTRLQTGLSKLGYRLK